MWGHGRALAHPLPPQNPAVVDAPLRLVLQVSAPPRCVIKPSGTSVSVSAFLNISLVPAGRPAVQLSSMAMVSAAPPSTAPGTQGRSTAPPGGLRVPKQGDSGAQGQQGSHASLSLGNEAERQGVPAGEGAARAAGPAAVGPTLGSWGGCRDEPPLPQLMAAFPPAGFASTPSSQPWSRWR